MILTENTGYTSFYVNTFYIGITILDFNVVPDYLARRALDTTN